MFAEVVRARRVRLGMTQEELAERTGLSVRGIRKLEAGQVIRPQPTTVRLLADAFALAGAERDGFCQAASGESVELPVDAGAPVPPRQLPAPAGMFTGRVGELAALDQLADGSTSVVAAVDGMAGVGKTALVVQWAHRVADRFPDGQVFLDLQGFTEGAAPVDAAAALERLLRTLGVPSGQIPDRLDDRAGLWRSTLAGRQMLLVLDNAAAPADVRPLLPGTAGCVVLVTSRHRLAALDPAVTVSLDVLPPAEAVSLFTRTIGRERPDPASREQVAEVVELCGRLPLAVRVAAARLRSHPSWGLADLADRLRRRREQLAELDDGMRSVNAALEVSYRQLSAGEQRMYRLLGANPGADVDVYAAAALGDLPAGRARRWLDQLLTVHLLQEPRPGRFTFHDLVRAHAGTAATAEAEPARQAAMRRLLDYFRHAAAEAMDAAYPTWRGQGYRVPPAGTPTPTLSDPADAVTWLDAELPNLLAAAAHANDCGLSAHAKQLAVILPEHLHTRGRYGELAALYRRGLSAAHATGDRASEAAALIGLGWVGRIRGWDASSLERFTNALQLSRAAGQRDQEAEALIGLSWSQLRQGQQEQAVDGFRTAVEITRLVGLRGRERGALVGLGWALWHQGRYGQAAREFSRSLEIARAMGNRFGEMDSLLALGNTHRALGQYQWALDEFARALTHACTTGHRHGEMHALLGFGNLHRALGRYESAIDHFSHACEIARTTGQRESEMDALSGIGHVHRRQGRYHLAREHYQRALDLAEASDSRLWQLEARYGLGRLHHAIGEPAAALADYQRALTLATNLRQPADEARINDGLAHVHHVLGEPESARRHWERTLEILVDLGVDHTTDGEAAVAGIRDHLTALASGAAAAGTAAPNAHR